MIHRISQSGSKLSLVVMATFFKPRNDSAKTVLSDPQH